MKFESKLILICLLGMGFQVEISRAQPFSRIATGNGHSLFLKSDGSLWAMGDNEYGQLGDGTYNATNLPEQILTNNVTAVTAGNGFSLFLKSDGSLWGMGYNLNGELGSGGTNNINHPVQIVPGNVTAIAAGLHSLFLKGDGSLWGMGFNGFGELGDGTTNNAYYPKQILTNGVIAIAAGSYHSLFIMGDGSLWSMGKNDCGELGNGVFNLAAPYGTNLPQKVVAGNVVAIAAGGGHSLFIKSDGSMWGMGRDAEGELGDGDYNYANVNQPEPIISSNVTAISAGLEHSLFCMNDGSLWAMGYNQYGQLGDGTYTYSSYYPLGVYLPEVIEPVSVKEIAAGDFNSLFVKNDDTLWGMGYDANGGLGDGLYNAAGISNPEQIVSVQAQSTNQLAPAITDEPGSQTNIVNSTITFVVNASSTLPINYQWQMNGTNLTDTIHIAGTTSSTLTIMGITDNDAGNYSVIVSNAEGWVTSSVVTLTVIDPPVIVGQPSSAIGLLGAPATFFVACGGSAPLAYQWQFNGTNILQATNSTFTIPVIGTNQAGYYSVGIMNPAGNVGSSNAALSVVISPISQSNYAGSTAIFSVATFGPEPLHFQWQKNGSNLIDGGNISGATNSILLIDNITDADSASYTAVVGNADSSLCTSNAWLTVNDLPFVSIEPLSQIAGVGSTVTFYAAAYGAQPFVFQWYFDNSPAGSPTTGANFSSYTLTNAQIDQAGNYSVQVFNGYGSVMSSNAILAVVYPPVITQQPMNLTNIAGSTAVFTMAASGDSIDYQWFNSFGPIPGAVSPVLTLYNVQDATAANYWVVVSNAVGSVTSSRAALAIIDPPTITIQPLSQQIIQGRSATFAVALNGTPPFQYQWLLNGSNITAATNDTLVIPTVTANNGGAYSVVVTNLAGTAASSNAVLWVIIPPSVGLRLLAGYPLLNLSGMQNSNFTVQYTTNLSVTNWINLRSITNLTSSPYQFLDPAGSASPMRFYRALMQ